MAEKKKVEETEKVVEKKPRVKKNTTAIDSRCPGCGSKLTFSPKKNK